MNRLSISLSTFMLCALLVAPCAYASVDLSQALSYSGQPGSGSVAVSSGTVTLTNNIWTVFALDAPLTLQADSDYVLSFDYQSDAISEIAGIGFDTDRSFGWTNAVKFGGTQGDNWPKVFADTTYVEGSGVQHYVFKLTDFLALNTTFNYLLLVNDDDGESGDGMSQGVFSNIYIGSAEGLNSAATPIPGAIFLLGTGVVGLLGIKRRQQL